MAMPPPVAQKTTMSPGLGPWPCCKGVIQRGRNAGRPEIAPLVHDPVRLAQRLAQVVHDELDGAQVELGKQEEIDLVDRDAGLGAHGADQLRPVVAVEGGRELADELHARLAQLGHDFRRGRAIGAAGVDAQGVMVFTGGRQLARSESRAVSGPTMTAAAPSAKRVQVYLSVQSTNFVMP